jgi:PAS domain S-box-containing protein
MESEAIILIAEAMALYFFVLFAHSLRHRFGTSFFFALIGGLTAVMSWVTDAGVAVDVGNITFVVGSTVFYTSLLLSVFVVYVFNGPRDTRIAISTVLCVSILVPIIAATLHLQMQYAGRAEIAHVPMPDLRINAASAVTTFIDLIFLAIAWEFLGKPNLKLKMWFRSYATLLGVMWLDVLLFATFAFAGTPEFENIFKGTLISRFVVSLLAFPFLYGYLIWENRKNGHTFENRPVLAILSRIVEAENQLFNIQQEIERRKRAEAELIRREALLEETGRMAKIGGWELATETMAAFWTTETYNIHEIPVGEVPSLERGLSFIDPEDRENVKTALQKALEEGKSYDIEARLTTAKGRARWVRTMCKPYRVNGRISKLIGTFQDITERKEMEQSLQAYRNHLEDQVEKRTQQLAGAKNQWEKTFDAILDWVAIIDKHYIIKRSNTSSKKFTGLWPKQIIGKHCYEVMHRTNRPVLDCPVKRSLISKQRESMEFQTASGRWLNVSVDPIDGAFEYDGHFVHVVRDITDFKKREQEIIAARKSEAFSILSGGIAHDYNNLLSVIWGNISLLREELPGEKVEVFFNEAEKACEQARKLTHQFIMLSRGTVLNRFPQSVKNLLTGAIENTEGLKANIEFSPDDLDQFHEINIDYGLMQIALQNIIINADEAMPAGGTIEIRASIAEDEDLPQESPRYLNLEFKDDGCGIAAADLHRVFDPYFSTKDMGTQKGMGLGLAVARSIILKHGGNIHIDSAPEKGATVLVQLPLDDSVRAIQSEAKTDILNDEKPTILLLEDSLSLRKLCQQMLERLNCEVIAASSVKDAIKQYKAAVKQNVRIDLVLLDQNIKEGLGGIEMLKQLKLLGYDQNSILVTGSPNSPAITHFKKYGFDGKLLKPYTKDELEEIIREFISC